MNNNFAGISFGYDSDKIFKERNATMCDKWKCDQSLFRNCSIDVYSNSNGSYIVQGDALNGSRYVKYWAANPPTYSQSFAGSGLPYPNENQAFENTPNQGVAEIKDGKFNFAVEYPNSYYKNMGTLYVPPQVKLQFCNENGDLNGKVMVLKLGNGIPFRSLTWPRERNWNRGPLFYCNNNLPVRNQEQILRDSGYPCTNTEPKNFWGTTPTH